MKSETEIRRAIDALDIQAERLKDERSEENYESFLITRGIMHGMRWILGTDGRLQSKANQLIQLALDEVTKHERN